MQTINPTLAQEWNYERNNGLTPADIMPNCSKKVWWRCSKNHEWQATSNARHHGSNCPYCAGKKVLIGYNDLQTTNPILAKEWNYEKNDKLTPLDITANSGKKVWWNCSNGHEWQAVIYSRNKGNGCPYCAGRKVIKGYNDLQTINPTVAKEWNHKKNGRLKPENFTSHSGKKVWWKCNKGHEWEAIIDNRSKGAGCPYCSGRRKVDKS